MGNTEEWAKKWLEDRRHEGKTCLEIKTHGSRYYVYHSTNRYDKEIKKGRKVSKYLGKLDKEKGFVPKGQNKQTVAGPRNITEYGNSMLLHEMMKDIKPILRAGFPDHWEEICALAMMRVPGNVPLKRAKDAWEKLYNAEDINPSLNQKNLSAVMRDVGVNRAGQNAIFKKLADMSNQLVYDLSSMFSRSMSIKQAEKGYNKDKIQVPQINLALLCSADTGLPTMIRSLPGSVKDIKTLYLFEDQDLRLEEQKTLYKKLDKHKIDRKKIDDMMKASLDTYSSRFFHSISTVSWNRS